MTAITDAGIGASGIGGGAPNALDDDDDDDPAKDDEDEDDEDEDDDGDGDMHSSPV
jgi:hypothetical protein